MQVQPVEHQIFSLLEGLFPARTSGAITRDTDLVRDLDADSMTIVSIIFSIDEKLNIGTDRLGDLVVGCHTVGDLVDATLRLQRERA